MERLDRSQVRSCSIFATICQHAAAWHCRSKTRYQREIQPILDAGGLHVNVVLTQRPGDAARLAAEADLDAVDAFAVVGGDGTIHELLQVP